MSQLLTLLGGEQQYGASISFNGPMLGIPYELARLGATFTRATEKRVYQNGALVTLASGQFGTTYDSVTGLYAYDPEPAATNLALHSSDLTNAVWTKVAATISANSVIAPDGSMTADKIVEDSATSAHYVSQSMTGKTMSVFAKAGERTWLLLYSGVVNSNVYFNLATGVVGTALSDVARSSIIPVGNGWYRCSVTWTTSPTVIRMYGTTGNGVSSWAGDGTSGIYVWGAMDEAGTRATSYIATAGATATRAADVLSVPLANIPGFSAAGYTIYIDGRADVSTGTLRYDISVNDASVNNYASISRTAASTVGTDVVSGGVSQSAVAEVSPGTARRKVALSCAANSFLRAVNGTGGTADVSGSMPVSPTSLNIGHHLGASQTNGFLYGIRLIPTSLNQAMTTSLTA